MIIYYYYSIIRIKLSNRFCELSLPPPKVKKKKPSGVNSLTNLLPVLIYLPGFTPGWSLGADGSKANISCI